MWTSAVQREVAHDVEQRLHVDARGRQQRARERRVELGVLGAQVEAAGADAGVDDAPDQRVAVAVDAARGEPEDHVALADARAVDQLVALDHADAEAHHLEIALLVDAGHRGGLAAEQRAAGAPAALGDPAQGLLRDLAIEPIHRDVVEEDQRLRALHDQVVHDHRHAVDADGVEAPELRGQPQLRADAVGARHEDRLLVAVGRLEQAGESADAREQLRAVRGARDLLDVVDEAFVVIEIDAGRGVARRRRAVRGGRSRGRRRSRADG